MMGENLTFLHSAVETLRVHDSLESAYDGTKHERITAMLQQNILTIAALKTWGLAVNTPTPDFKAIKRLLDERYMHSKDDISHSPLLREKRSRSLKNGRPKSTARRAATKS